MMLTETHARSFVQMTLPNLTRRWPFKLDQVIAGPGDVVEPAVLHPVFHGSFDWHSCVHGYWQVLRLLRLFPDLPEAADIRVLADAMLVPGKVAGEIARFDRPDGRGASRPYGWAWLLALHHEAEHHDAPWGAALEPLATKLAAMLGEYMARMTYPITVGTHFNSAFAMVLALGWAEGRDPDLAAALRERALLWFAGRTDYRGWEPGGDEFLSPALTAALLMGRVLEREAFAAWFANFLPHADGAATCRAVRTGARVRPHRRQDRPSRRAQPQPRVVLERYRRRARHARSLRRRWPSATSPPACRISAGTTWDRTGSAASPCWHSAADRAKAAGHDRAHRQRTPR